MKKKISEKKNAERNWAIAQLSCEKKKKLYCNLAIVLQDRRLEKKICIAIVLQEKGVVGWFVLQWAGIVLQYRSLDKGIGSQYTDCIVTRRG